MQSIKDVFVYVVAWFQVASYAAVISVAPSLSPH